MITSQILLQTFFLCNVAHAVASSLSCITTAFIRRGHHRDRFSLALRGRSHQPISSFTTISHFEREEDDAEYDIWVDVDIENNFEGNNDIENIFDKDFDEDFRDEDNRHKEKSKSRWRIRSNVKTARPYETENLRVKEDCMEEHPMRTDEWTIKVKLSPLIIFPGAIRREGALFPQFHNKKQISKSSKMKEQIMKFSKNGYVILLEEGESTNNDDSILNNEDESMLNDEDENVSITASGKNILSVGKWHMNANGISWKMPAHLPKSDENERSTAQKSTFLHYHADIHLSKFQSKPRMFRGTITRDRYEGGSSSEEKKDFCTKKLFRPVIASFTAEGTGEDTLVLQYKDRGFGLGNNGR